MAQVCVLPVPVLLRFTRLLTRVLLLLLPVLAPPPQMSTVTW